MPSPGSRPTSVYGAYNHDGQLIYIGIAHNPRRRWAQHRAKQPWAAEVHQWRELARYPTRTQARAHETWVITNTPTRWNRDGSPHADQVAQLYHDPHQAPPTRRHALLRTITQTCHRMTRNHRQ